MLFLLFLPDHNNLEAASDIGVQLDCGFVCPQLFYVWQVHQLFVQLSASLTLNSIYHLLLCHTTYMQRLVSQVALCQQCCTWKAN